MLVKSKIFLAVFLILGLLATPASVAAATTRTHIEIVDSNAYDPGTNTLTTAKSWTDQNYNLIVQLRDNHGNLIKGEKVYFSLYEKPNQDMNGNGITSENLFTESDCCDRYFDNENEVSVAKWFKNKLPNLPVGDYNVVIHFDGDSRLELAHSEKFVNIHYLG
jgi:hypothetical protein